MTTTTDETKRPPRTTLEGMIWNANQVLEWALDPKANGIPHSLFEIAVGLVIVSVVEVGFIFSGNAGTGVLFKKQPRRDGVVGTFSHWSAPSAVGMTGVGYGFLVGASVKELMIFIMDELTLESVCTAHGFKLGVNAEATLGPLGRSYQVDGQVSKKGLGNTVSIAFTQGLFAGFSVSGAVLGVRDKVNEQFYNTPGITVQDILNQPRADVLKKADGKVHLLDDVYDKLQKVEDGLVETVKNEIAEKQKKANAAKAAEEAHHDYVNTIEGHDIVEVDAASEAFRKK